MPPRNRRPRKELDCKRIETSLRANILTLVSNDVEAVACRAVWRVEEGDLQLANNQIASKRLELDEALSKVRGVQFFLSCITVLSSNAKRSRSENSDKTVAPAEKDYPAVAYFIAFRVNDNCNENILYAILHNQDTEPTVRPIIIRKRTSTKKTMDKAARQLFQVLKDHNNPLVIDLLRVSNAYCFAECSRTSSAEESQGQDEATEPIHYPTAPCRLVVVNKVEFGDKLHAVLPILQSDGLMVELDSDVTVQLEKPCLSSTTNEVPLTLKKIERILKICDHALYRGHVYAMPAGATMAYLKMMDVGSYLNKLLTNEPIRAMVLKHFPLLLKVLSHPACEIIRQIEFDLDIIEVSNGYCFRITTRSFVPCPIPVRKRGTLSPRTFIPYDCSKEPAPGFFEEGILNSFPNADVRVNFLNKFYQCLVASKMPHKVRKLVVAGPKDSGKTSWASIFHRIVPNDKIASITNERQFSAAMITEQTQLVLVDEWSQATLQSDLAKTILQGGWMVTAVKHGLPRSVMNNSPFYITTNYVPNFGREDENVKRRIAVFETSSLPQTLPGVDRWIYDNAMHCVAWMAKEISENRDLVDAEELWYEPGNADVHIIENNEGLKLFEASRLSEITHADLEKTTNASSCSSETDAIHQNFQLEFNRQRLSRKRRSKTLNPSPELESFSTADDDQIPAESECDEGDKSLSSLLESFIDERSQSSHAVPDVTVSADRSTTDAQNSAQAARDDCSLIPDTINEDEAERDELKIVGEGPSTSIAASFGGNREDNASPPVAIDKQKDPARADEQCSSKDVTPWNTIENDNSNDSQEIFRPRILTPSCWVLNDRKYLAKVAQLLQHSFDNPRLSRVHARSFIERKRKAELKKNKRDREFWTKPDPFVDAWMLIIGKRRDIFDVDVFVTRHPEAYTFLQNVRKIVNVQVLPCSCPVYQAIEESKRVGGSEDAQEVEDVDSEGSPRRPKLSSQTYWTKLKRWRPWR